MSEPTHEQCTAWFGEWIDLANKARALDIAVDRYQKLEREYRALKAIFPNANCWLQTLDGHKIPHLALNPCEYNEIRIPLRPSTYFSVKLEQNELPQGELEWRKYRRTSLFYEGLPIYDEVKE